MKAILLLLAFMAGWPLYNQSFAQCVVKNVLVKVNSTTPSSTIPGACNVDFDFVFTIENNGGNKYIYLHAWMADEYPNNFGCPSPANNSKPPVAADLATARINVGIHNEIHAGHPEPTLISIYYPDPSVVLTTAGSLIRSVYPTGDSARFIIKNVRITVPAACSDVIQMKADFWSSQAQAAQNAQCVFCDLDFTIDPRVNGLINCILPHTFNVAITSSAPFSISGYYEVFLDNPADPLNPATVGTYGAEDTIKVYSAPYATQFLGNTNLFTALNVPYPPYNGQKPDSDKNLWVVVTTNQYTNKAVNIINNSCAPLGLKLTEFSVLQKAGAVLLQWNSVDEKDMNGFAIERKKQGEVAFKEIGFIDAYSNMSDNSGNFSYTFTDKLNTDNSMMLYRLKMIEKDGSYSYSDIRSIRTGAAKPTVLVYPNPNKGSFRVTVPVNSGIYDMILCDNSGRVVKQLLGLRNTQSEVSGIVPQGVYVIKIHFRETGDTLIEKIVVL